MSRFVLPLSLGAVAFAFATPAHAATIDLDGTLRDFTPSTHPDFERSICGLVTGMVETTLGSDGNPVRSATASCLSTRFGEWYEDTAGVNLAYPHTVTLTETSPGTYSYSSSSFFPLDGRGFGNYSGGHNYHFTYEIHTTFGYAGGETFNFTGDDDLWIFINGTLAVDIGGIHGATSRTIDLDTLASTLGITPGHNYTFDVFFAERHTTQSNFNITTSIVFSQEDCDDGTDNDGDGSVDDADDDCWVCGDGTVDPNEECDPLGDPTCGADCGPAVEDCDDGVDNDGDGDADTDDSDCCAEPDLDGDGVCGEDDNCDDDFNPDQDDVDGDTVGDECDECPDDVENDADGDDVCEIVDNCDTTANDQTDTDGDGDGDACDVCPVDAANDADGDGVCEVTDNCDTVANSDQADADTDGAGDTCDVCPYDADDDIDADGVCGDTDNCVDDENADQADADGDGTGDACDVCPDDPDDDADGDGVCGDVDLCEGTTLPEDVPTVSLGVNRWADTDGDGVFDTVLPRGRGPTRSYTIEQTDGCSCGDIIEVCGYGDGHTKYGCSISVMDAWVAGGCH